MCRTPTSRHHDALAGGISPGQKGFPHTPPLSFNLYLHSPNPRTICLFCQKPAEGHVTTLSSPPLGTSCTFFKHTAPGERAKGEKPSTERQHGRCSRAVTTCRGHSGLQKEAPVCWPSGLTGMPWAILASHPAAAVDAQSAVLSLSTQEESQTDSNNEMSALSTMLNKCHTLFLV